jgi:N-acetylglutamate synthase-like GNAT family acetyltransferase
MAFFHAAGPFSEKGFYLSEFRGRTLALALRELERTDPLGTLLGELEANATRVVLLSADAAGLRRLLGSALVARGAPRFEGDVWRAFSRAPHVGVVIEDGDGFAHAGCQAALRLAVRKLVWVDEGGGLAKPDGARLSFVHLEELRALLAEGLAGEKPDRVRLLREVEAALAAGLPALNLTTLDGVADELFTYAGSGTLFTRERYVVVRRLGLDDYDAADDLIARGVTEGYLAPRSSEEIDRILVNGFGAFVEGRHLAGIGALLEYPEARQAEISSLYTLTRFLGEGVGTHLVGYALERARERGFRAVFACTTSERVVGFFERHGFRLVSPEDLPAEKWRAYDRERRGRVRCLARDVAQERSAATR